MMTAGDDLTFTLSAQGGVAAFAWLDHPAGTVGYFKDVDTGVPSNGFFLIPGIDHTGTRSQPRSPNIRLIYGLPLPLQCNS